MNENNRKLFLWLVPAAALVAAISGISQVAARSVACGDLVCQLDYAASYSRIADLPLGGFVLLGTVGLVLVLAFLQLIPKWFGTVGRFLTLAVCIGGFVLTSRIAAIEAVLLHGWSWSCIVASLLASLLLVAGIFLAETGYPKTRLQGGGVLLGAVVVAALSWHLMQSGGITRVRRQAIDARVLSPTQGHSLGPNSARVQIVEFADFQCPPCRHVAPDLRKLVAKYNGNVRLVQREFPNVRRHPQAQRAAEIAECFGEQGKYWEAAAELYKSASIPEENQLGDWATRLGADSSKIMACMTEHRGLPAVTQDRQDGHALGVSVTPTLFIGSTVLEGSTSFEKLEGLLRSEMAGHSQMTETESKHLMPARTGCAVQPESAPQNQTKNADTHCD
jgi:protein-disulfide isomerase